MDSIIRRAKNTDFKTVAIINTTLAKLNYYYNQDKSLFNSEVQTLLQIENEQGEWLNYFHALYSLGRYDFEKADSLFDRHIDNLLELEVPENNLLGLKVAYNIERAVFTNDFEDVLKNYPNDYFVVHGFNKNIIYPYVAWRKFPLKDSTDLHLFHERYDSDEFYPWAETQKLEWCLFKLIVQTNNSKYNSSTMNFFNDRTSHLKHMHAFESSIDNSYDSLILCPVGELTSSCKYITLGYYANAFSFFANGNLVDAEKMLHAAFIYLKNDKVHDINITAMKSLKSDIDYYLLALIGNVLAHKMNSETIVKWEDYIKTKFEHIPQYNIYQNWYNFKNI